MAKWANVGWALLALLAMAPAAGAQDGAAQARAYLEGGMAAHEGRGYRVDRTNPEMVAPLRLDSAQVFSVYLRAGENYRIYGACDNACGDLDMEIYGIDGALADRDVATDDTPFVQYSPAQTGRAYVRLWVYACAREPCVAAARVVMGGRPETRARAERAVAPAFPELPSAPPPTQSTAQATGQADDSGLMGGRESAAAQAPR